MCGIRDSFIYKTKFCIIWNQPVLTRKYKTFSSLLLRILDCSVDQFSCISMPATGRDCIYAENHLPCSMLIMQLRFFIHFIRQICFIRNKSIHKSDQFLPLKHKPEMITIMLQPFCKLFFGCCLCRRETFCLHSGYHFQIIHCCCSYLQFFVLPHQMHTFSIMH